MSNWKIAGISFASLIALILLGYVFGMNRVLYTKTVGKAQKNADREVFEQTQSYVDSKRQEALKLYREYLKADQEEKASIRLIAAHSFAAFDENKLDGDLYNFIYDCKYR